MEESPWPQLQPMRRPSSEGLYNSLYIAHGVNPYPNAATPRTHAGGKE